VTGCDTGAINLWDWKGDGMLVSSTELFEHDNVVRSVDVSRDGLKIVSASDDRSLRIWSADTSEGTASTECFEGPLTKPVAHTLPVSSRVVYVFLIATY
jgi:WD40 repeat protein